MKIIHVMGLVGAGKTTFIKKKLSRHQVFDIKDVYQEYGFKPEDIKEPDKYTQFTAAIQFTIDRMIQYLQANNLDVLIVESSGINKAINKAINHYDKLRIWVDSHYPKRVENKRTYAKELNRAINQAYEKKIIKFDLIYDADIEKFTSTIPIEFAEYLN